jgi:hypothetical protein
LIFELVEQVEDALHLSLWGMARRVIQDRIHPFTSRDFLKLQVFDKAHDGRKVAAVE